MPLDLSRHPCFNDSSRHRFGRVHLPVAPKCNVRCNFCDRKHDCVSESRPGVSSTLLSPHQAAAYLDEVVKKSPRIAVVGIAGPGDPFANPTETMETLRLVRRNHPEMLMCVASNGLAVESFVEEMAELEVSHVTITVNAVDPEIGAKIYAWVRPEKRAYRGIEGATLMLERQMAAIAALKRHGITVKINSIIIPGVNDRHIGEVARRVTELGADIMNCVPLCPVEGTPFGELGEPDALEVARIRGEAGAHMSLMHHCTRCRADAVGLLGQSTTVELQTLLTNSARLPRRPAEDRPHVAVATREGVLVNQHLGEAETLAIYSQTIDGHELVEYRSTPPSGGGATRWRQLAQSLHDCRAVLVASAGKSPRDALEEAGIDVVMMEGLIVEGLDAVFDNQPIRAPLRAEHRCGSGCSGDGMGCG